MDTQKISTGNPWEKRFGFSRAFRKGPHVWVSGTIASDKAGNIAHPNDAYGQACYIFKKIETVLLEAKLSLDHIVRTRMFIINGDDSEAVGKAHFEFVGHNQPAATMVAVKEFVHPDALVEIEVDAFDETKSYK